MGWTDALRLRAPVARLSLTLLGGFQARLEPAGAVSLPTKKAQALLAYLALPLGQAHPRDKLAALLWGGIRDESARNSLRQALFALRKALTAADPPSLRLDGDLVALDPAAVEVDVVAFERAAVEATPAALERAAALYHGDFLAGLAVDEAPFEEWLLGERERLRELALEALAKLLRHQRDAAIPEAAVQTALKLLSLDPLQEAVHRALMRLYTDVGRRGAALRQYQHCVAVLQRELGVEPEAETKQLYQEILRRTDESGEAGTVPAKARMAAGRRSGLGRPDHITGETPLVGRETELAALRNAFDEARAGRGRMVGLLGEAGVGKTRLAMEVVAEAWRAGASVLLGHAYASTQSLPFAPWVDAVRGSGIIQAPSALDGLGPQWRQELARLFPELGSVALSAADSGNELRLFEAMAHLIIHLVARQPLLLVLEDLHWADETSLRLLAFVTRRVQQSAVLIIITAREEDLVDAAMLEQVLKELDREQRLTTLRLLPLSREDTAALVLALAPGAGGDAATVTLAERVWVTSAGNPFTVLETLRAAREGVATRVAGELPLPQRVREVITARLDRLSSRARELAAVAAVIGRVFDFALLRRAAGLGDRDAAEAVEELVRRRVLHGVAEGFDFTHDRIRTTAYEGLLVPRRQVLHAAVGQALEDLHAPQLERVWSRLAYHYANAEDAEKAVSYLSLAAEQAARVYAHTEALAALERADGLIERLPANAGRERIALTLILRRAQSLYFLGRFQDSVALLEQHRARVDRLDDPTLSGAYHFWLAHMYARLVDRERAAENARRAMEAASRANDAATLGKAHGVLALEAFYLGEPRRGIEDGQRAATLLEQQGELWWQGMAHFYLGMNAVLSGDFRLALDSASRTGTMGERIQDPRLQSYAAFLAGWVHATCGECDIAIQRCQESLERSPDPVSACYASAFLGYAWLEQGDVNRAISLLEPAVQELERFKYAQMRGWFMTFLGEAHRRQGRLETARNLASQGLELATQARFRAAMGRAHQMLGRIALSEDALGIAVAELENAREIFAVAEAPFEEARILLDIAAASHRSGDVARAAQHLADAHAVFARLATPRYVERTAALARRFKS